MFPIFVRATSFKRAFKPAIGLTSALAMLAACAIATPYRATEAALSEPETDMVIFAITEASLSADRNARAGFWEGVAAVREALPEMPGLLGYSLRQEPFGDRVWTMTSWDGEENLRNFVLSPVHQRAIEMGTAALDDVRFARVLRRADQPPLTWEEALAALETGRRGYETSQAGPRPPRVMRNE